MRPPAAATRPVTRFPGVVPPATAQQLAVKATQGEDFGVLGYAYLGILDR